MNSFFKLIKTDVGRKIISVMWGLGLATMFQRICKDRSCIVYTSPNPSDIKNKTYKKGDQCYKFDTEISECGNNMIEWLNDWMIVYSNDYNNGFTHISGTKL